MTSPQVNAVIWSSDPGYTVMWRDAARGPDYDPEAYDNARERAVDFAYWILGGRRVFEDQPEGFEGWYFYEWLRKNDPHLFEDTPVVPPAVHRPSTRGMRPLQTFTF